MIIYIRPPPRHPWEFFSRDLSSPVDPHRRGASSVLQDTAVRNLNDHFIRFIRSATALLDESLLWARGKRANLRRERNPHVDVQAFARWSWCARGARALRGFREEKCSTLLIIKYARYAPGLSGTQRQKRDRKGGWQERRRERERERWMGDEMNKKMK